VIVGGIIELSEGLKPPVEVAWEGRRVVVAQTGCVESKIVIVVIREVSDFLRSFSLANLSLPTVGAYSGSSYGRTRAAEAAHGLELEGMVLGHE
jgi:hypothetical protein